MTYVAPILGLLAGVVGIADTIPYVRDTVGPSRRSPASVTRCAPHLAMLNAAGRANALGMLAS
jgi:hypothetical protein